MRYQKERGVAGADPLKSGYPGGGWRYMYRGFAPQSYLTDMQGVLAPTCKGIKKHRKFKGEGEKRTKYKFFERKMDYSL